MRVIWLVVLVCACAGGGDARVTCYGEEPATAAGKVADELRGQGWGKVRVLVHPRIAGRVNVVGRRGDQSVSALVEPGCDGAKATVGVVRGKPVTAREIGPGGPGRPRVSTF